MNLLIVDDQTSVVNGLRSGIDWDVLGITGVYCAYNANEARQILSLHRIDVMLCDIEMPMENGLELLSWMRANHLETECIFLTAHAEFNYAKEALNLRSFDYIVQPAPYEEVEAVVSRALEKVRNKNEHNRTFTYGKALMSQNELLRDQAVGDWILGRISAEEYRRLSVIENLPGLDTRGTLVLMQILGEPLFVKQWEPQLLKFTFHNVIAEHFYYYAQSVIVYSITPMTWFIIVYGTSGNVMDQEGVKRQIGRVSEAFTKWLKFDAAFYMENSCVIQQMPQLYLRLEAGKRQNVLLKPQVITVASERQGAANEGDRIFERYFLAARQSRWKMYIHQNLSEAAFDDIKTLLHQLADDGILCYTVLRRFLLFYDQTVNSVIENGQGRYPDIFRDQRVVDLNEKAADSLDCMEAYIGYTLSLLTASEDENLSEKNQLKLVDEYIHEHMEDEIHRGDIADYLHLNVDYLGRIFKKQRGVSLKEYIIEEKMRVARELLKTTMLPISFVASKVGYSNSSNFSRIYKKVIGIPPTEERKE